MAQKYGTTIRAIVDANTLDSNKHLYIRKINDRNRIISLSEKNFNIR
ncbi:LysM peptidoglycan-binding domain-containing protein [Geobacillus sp. 44B]|nr:hypothetical protein BSK33_16175 [Geobacillus sp. 44B]QNU39599.1 LysM peptidoglycan-binding domain-containing protein [Geobacillus sp. 44B]